MNNVIHTNYEKNKKEMKVNIGGDQNDASYRYKRSQVEFKKIKTHGGLQEVTNLKTLARELKVPLDVLERRFYDGVRKLGVKVFPNLQTKGQIEKEDYEKIINSIIKTYLLCPQCGLPEFFKKSCNACGFYIVSEKQQSKGEDRPVKWSEETLKAVKVAHKLYDIRIEAMKEKEKARRKLKQCESGFQSEYLMNETQVMEQIASCDHTIKTLDEGLDMFWIISENDSDNIDMKYAKWLKRCESKFAHLFDIQQVFLEEDRSIFTIL